MMDDWLMHNRYKKVHFMLYFIIIIFVILIAWFQIPKFQDVHYVANIANAFIEELYKSEDDRQK